MKYVIFLCLIFITGCASQNNSAGEAASIKLLDDHTLSFSGATSPHNASVFQELLESNAGRIDTVRINSGGGDVFGGMAMGRLVHEHKLKVIVEDICASSCANYVVTASHDVLVTENSLLGWHGGSTQTLYVPMKNSTPWHVRIAMFFTGNNTNALIGEFTEKWQAEEREFFELVNAEQVVTVLGMMPGLKEKRDASLFSYDLATLERLGLNVAFEDKQLETIGTGDKIIQIFYLDEEQLAQLLTLHNEKIQQASKANGEAS